MSPALRGILLAIGILGLAGTLPWLVATPQPPAWAAPALARAASAPLRAEFPDSVFERLQEDYAEEIGFTISALYQTLGAAHRHPDRWLALPLFALLAVVPCLPAGWRLGRERTQSPSPDARGVTPAQLARFALLGLVPLQLLFHASTLQPLLGAWVDLWGNLVQILLTIQILADRYFVAGVEKAVVLFFAEQSPRLEAQLLRQLWLLRSADLLLAGFEAWLLITLARRVRRSAKPG